MRKLLLLPLLMLILSGTYAQKSDVEYVEYDLPNGLHVILHQDNSVPIVAVSVMYHVGSKNEETNRTGFAHFFEHLMFEGSDNIARGEFDNYIDNAGGMNNANTSQDRTFYYEVLPSNQLDLALWLESERMLHAKVDAEGIETQREVVKEEKRQRVDNRPYGTLLQELMKRAYTTHPYRWQPIGSMEDLNAASDEDFKNFYATYYVPNNATLSIAGNIDIKKAKKSIKAYFKNIPKGAEISRPSIVEPAQTAEVRDTVYDNIQLPAVVHGWKIPSVRQPDFYAMQMLFQLMAQGPSSRLNTAIRDDKGMAVFVGAFPFSLEDNPNISIAFALATAGTDPGDLEAAMDVEYARLRDELVSEEEFQKLRNQVENDFYSGNSTMVGIAENLADYHVFYGDAALINSEIDHYMAVSREDIREVARKYLLDTNRVTLYYLPKSAELE